MKIYNRIYNGQFIKACYQVTRYSCGHYSLLIIYPTKSVYYPRLLRCQIEAVANINCKEVFGLKH